MTAIKTVTLKKNDEREMRVGRGLREKACVPWGMEEKEISDNGEEKLECGMVPTVVERV